jgi:hypothetical protein
LVLRRVLWLLGLDALLRGFDVGWHFLLCLAADDERDEQFGDAVPVEVDRDSEPGTGFGQGFHVTSTVARMGPSMPRTPHVLGASMWVSSEVTTRLAPPMRRVVRHFVPTCAGRAGPGDRR